ncbi:MAG TPA: hypothetical protein PKY59_14595 [Pyrinomonadaceae bacterium]|nr:hypothetical protein [Pyrinomonadaceae bacterium]
MQTLEEITALADKLTPSEKIKLVKHLAISLEKVSIEDKKPQSLKGIWQDKFPADFDAEKEIREIRDAWKKKFEDL